MRRWTAVAVCAAVVALVGSAGAAAKGHDKGPREHELVQWTLVGGHGEGQCPLLPDGLVLTGKGKSKTMDKIKTKHDGVMEEKFRESVKGTATDNRGGHYTFFYVNTFKGKSPGAGIATDHSDLSGDGVANLLSEFQIDFAFLEDWIPASDPVFTVTAGDPEHCDPI